MSHSNPATVSRSVLFGGLILLALGLITGGIIGASITRNAEVFEAKLAALGGDLEMVRGENASLRNALDDLKAETGKLRSQIEETAKETRPMRDSLAGLQKEVGHLKGGLDSAKQENAHLADLVEKERRRIDGNVEQIGAYGEGQEKEARKLSELAATIEGVKKDVAAGNSQRQASEKEHQAIRTDLDSVSQDLEAARSTMGKLIQAIAGAGP